MRRHATALATRIEAEADLERKRSRILECINGPRPLAQIMEQITALVSSKLGGVVCWCQVRDEARLGGDEFAVLVPQVHNREDVEDVATRLERSFDEPFIVNSYRLHGFGKRGHRALS